jgi:transposase
MARERKRYTEEFKQRAVRLTYEPGRSIRTVAEGLGISTNVLQKWRQHMPELRSPVRSQQGNAAPEVAESDRELARENRELRREVELLKQERDILKKAMAYFAQPPK